MLSIMMVAAPGVPGGGVMTAIGLLESMLGFNESMIALMNSRASIHQDARNMQGIDLPLPGKLMEQSDPTPCSDLFGRSFATE